MPEYVHEKRPLHSARLSAREFAEIDEALRLSFKPPHDSITWEFTRKRSRSNTGDDLSKLVLELADKTDITGFKITAKSNETSDVVAITGGDPGCFVEYTASDSRLDRIRTTLRLIEGVFKDRRRKRTRAPIALVVRPFLEIGARKEGPKLPWMVIAQDALTKVLSYALTAGLAFVAGLMFSRFS